MFTSYACTTYICRSYVRIHLFKLGSACNQHPYQVMRFTRAYVPENQNRQFILPM